MKRTFSALTTGLLCAVILSGCSVFRSTPAVALSYQNGIVVVSCSRGRSNSPVEQLTDLVEAVGAYRNTESSQPAPPTLVADVMQTCLRIVDTSP